MEDQASSPFRLRSAISRRLSYRPKSLRLAAERANDLARFRIGFDSYPLLMIVHRHALAGRDLAHDGGAGHLSGLRVGQPERV